MLSNTPDAIDFVAQDLCCMGNCEKISFVAENKIAESNSSQIVDKSNDFFETSLADVGKAIQAVKEGKLFYAFIEVLTEEEKKNF